jgi:CHAT domain-containing protein
MSIAATTHRRICIAGTMLLAILGLQSLAAVGRGDEPSATEKKDAPAVAPEMAEIVALFQQGMALSGKGQWAEAAPVLEKAAARAKAALGPDHVDTANVTMRYADALFYLKQYDQSLPLFLESLAILRRRLPREHPIVTYAVNDLGETYLRMGRFAEAEQLHWENLKVREASLGKDHPHTLLSLYNLGQASEGARNCQIAIGSYEDWLQRNERLEGDSSPLIVAALIGLGQAQRSLWLMEPAEKNYLRALKIQRTRKDADVVRLAWILNDLVEVMSAANPPRLDQVELYAEDSYQILKRKLGPNDARTIDARGRVALAYQKAGKLAEAEPRLREVLKALAAIGHSSALIAMTYQESLVKVCLDRHRAAEAEPICLALLELLESHPTLQHEIADWCSVIHPYTQVCNQTGHCDQGKSRLARLLATVEKQVGKNDPCYAQSLAAVGAGYHDLGANAEARQYLLQSVSMLRATSGPQNPDLARALLELGTSCRQMSSFTEAEPYFMESHRILWKTRGENDPNAVADLTELGYIYMRTERHAEAVKYLSEVLRVTEGKPGPLRFQKARAMDDLGRIYTETGHPREAEPLLNKALAFSQQVNGRESFSVALVQAHLGDVYFHTGRKEQAERSYREALRIAESAGGKDHPDIGPMLSRLRDILDAKGQHNEAEKLLARGNQLYAAHADISRRDHLAQLSATIASAMRNDDYQQAIRSTTELRRLSNRWLKSVLPGMPPRERLVYLGADHWWGLARSMSVGLRYCEHPEAVAASAQWLLNGKAMDSELLGDEIRRARQSDDPAVAQTLRELADVRDQLAHLPFTRLPADKPVQGEPNWPDLFRHERQLTMQLGMQTYDVSGDDAWIALEDVRQAIPADAVLVDVLRFPVWQPGESAMVNFMRPARYVAWVISPTGKNAVQLIDLGSADLIDDAVARYRQAIESLPELVKKGPREMSRDRTYVETVRLSALLWKPLQTAVGNAKGLIVSPDGALWLVPWEALLTGPKEFLVEQMRIRYVVSGRALLAKQSEVPGRTAVLFADPDYDRELVPGSNEELAEWLAAEKRNWGKPKPKLPAALRVERLSNAEALATALATALEHYLHEPPVVYQRGEAQERAFKRLQNPRVLVVATHGSFQSDPGHDNLPSPNTAGFWGALLAGSPANRERSQSLINPLLRCNLALAGANHRLDAQGGNDGILTGMEILNTDLRGTDLVVLLACQTGLGAVEDGEGVAGLHHAFQLAGARTVLASLWSIPAQPSGKLVQAFLENLAIQPDKAMALRKAQLAMIAEQREKYGVAHPSLWAGLVLVGNARETIATKGKK